MFMRSQLCVYRTAYNYVKSNIYTCECNLF